MILVSIILVYRSTNEPITTRIKTETSTKTGTTMNITVTTKDFIDENTTLAEDKTVLTPVTDTSYPVSMNSSLLCKFSYFLSFLILM